MVPNAHLHKINEIWTVNPKEENFGLFLAVNPKGKFQNLLTFCRKP